MKPFLSQLLGCALLAMALQACTPAKPGIYKNDQISSGKLKDFHKLIDNVTDLLKKPDLKLLKLQMSTELAADPMTERNAEHAGNWLTDDKYSVMDEYYVVNKKAKDTIRISTPGADGYTIKYGAPVKETYIAQLTPKDKGDQHMITLIYNKLSYGWKLTGLEVDQYMINGKTAPQLYSDAKAEFQKNHLINAYLLAGIAIECLKPDAEWYYNNDANIGKFNDSVVYAANHKFAFPIHLFSMPSNPMVTGVYTKRLDNGLGTCLMVDYMTHYDIADTNAVKKENAELRKVLVKQFPGLDQNKYVLYEAFNKFQTASESVDRFDMLQKN